MKALILLFSLVFVGCVTSGVKARSVAQTACNIENYQDFIFKNKEGVYRCNLRGAKLIEVDLRGANLRGADLRGANLLGVNFFEADLRGADLRGADLQRVFLKRAKLQGAKVTQSQADYLTSEGYSGFVVVE